MLWINKSPVLGILYFCLLMPYKICVSCERILENKMETKVEIEVTYKQYKHSDKDGLTPPHKVFQFTYIVQNSPKTMSPEARGSARQSNNNVRHGFKFSTIEKGAGSFTMSTYENDGSDQGVKMRNNLVFGKLIHVFNLPQLKTDLPRSNSSVFNWSHNACNDVVNSVQGSWVALIYDDKSCSVEEKMRHIYKLSNQPTSVLIYGSTHVIIKHDPISGQDETPLIIYIPWSNIERVVQMCYNSSGNLSLSAELRRKNGSLPNLRSFKDQNQCNVTIKVYTTSDDNFLNKTSVLFVSISFILLMVISLAWLMFYYVQRFRYIHTKEQFSRRLAHMAKKAVAKIPVKTIKQGDKETDAEVDNCAICIECYKPSDTVRILPCKHYFHKSCIDPWLLEQRSCPMCKLNILHAYGFLPNERGSMISEDRLSELDSSLELQFMPGSTVTSYPGPCTRIQTHCQTRDSSDSSTVTVQPTTTIITLPSIFTNESNSQHRWMSLRLKRPSRNPSHHIDRSMSLRHLSSSSVEERTTFLPHNGRPLSQSATNTSTEPRLSLSQWQHPSTSISSAVVVTNISGDTPPEGCLQ